MSNVNGIVLDKIMSADLDEATKSTMAELFRIQRDYGTDVTNPYIQTRFKEIIERCVR